MATTSRYPVVLWRDRAGMYTGRLLDEDSDGVAVSKNRSEVLEQLDAYLRYLQKDYGHWIRQEFLEPRIRLTKVSVYPEYRESNRTYACKEALKLRLPCITGERENGMLTALFPTVDVAFDFHERESFNKVATHYIRRALRGSTPQQLSRYLSPGAPELAEIVVTLKSQKRGRFGDDFAQVPHLAAIADPLISRDRRRVAKTWERESEVASVEVLLGEEPASLGLVGPSGCGKSSVLIEAARRVEAGARAHEGSGAKRTLFWLTNAGRIIAGMRYLGQWEERCEMAIAELARLRGVLCVENLLELVRLGGTGPETSIGAFLLPFVQNGELRLVAEATPEEIDACDRLLPGLIDVLRIVKLEPFDDAKGLRVMERAANYLEQSENLAIEGKSPAAVLHLFRRFQPYAAFPGEAVDFLGHVVEQTLDAGERFVGVSQVRRAYAALTGLPETILDESVPLARDELETALNRRVIGQEDAVREMVKCLVKFKAGLNDPRRPLGVFLYCGPTGVGKTALARAMGDRLFPGKPEKERLIRLDMSEYAGFDAAVRLLGDRNGPSDFIRRLRRSPFSVILLDEIEKASPEVFDVFLNVFEEGRLTDALGRVTSFQSAIIIMTSNLGASGARRMAFDTREERVDREAIRSFFRPEFFNRLDEVLSFRPLDAACIELVTRRELDGMLKREGIVARGLSLSYAGDLIAFLSREGFDPDLGARPLQRKIEEVVTVPLAHFLLEQAPNRGAELKLSLDEGGRLTIEPARSH